MKNIKETFKVAFFVIGNLIGAGFFLMPSSVACLGRNLIWSWCVGAFIALVFASILGKLYILYPDSNDLSSYFKDFYLRQTVAILYWIGIVIGNVIVLTMIISVLKLSSYSNTLFFVAALILVLSFGNSFFKEEDVVMIETILSSLKFALLILIPLMIFLYEPQKLHIPVANGRIRDILQIGALSFWSFMGIETAGVFGKGKAARNGLFIGISACFLLYVLSCFLIVGWIPLSLLLGGEEIPIIYLVKFSKFSKFSDYVGYLIVFTSIASLYGWFTTSSKTALSFAKSKVFPSNFLKETKSGASFWGLWGSAVLTFLAFFVVSGFSSIKQFELIADFCVNISLIIFALCSNVLYCESSNFIDVILGLLGMILVVILLSMNFLFSLFSIIFFILFYFIFKNVNFLN